MAKYYFSSDDEKGCFTLDYFYESMREGEEMTVYPAKMVVGENVYYCRELRRVEKF